MTENHTKVVTETDSSNDEMLSASLPATVVALRKLHSVATSYFCIHFMGQRSRITNFQITSSTLLAGFLKITSTKCYVISFVLLSKL